MPLLSAVVPLTILLLASDIKLIVAYSTGCDVMESIILPEIFPSAVTLY